MSTEYFLDTNVLVYAFDQTQPKKRERARDLLDPKRDWAISWQVVQEFSSVALHRFAEPVNPNFLENFLELVRLPKCLVMPSQSLYTAAISLHRKTQYRFYDSSIATAAVESVASALWTGDLQAGRPSTRVQIENPSG